MVLETVSTQAGIDWITATSVKRSPEVLHEESFLESLYITHRVKGAEREVKFGGYSGLSDGNGLKVGVRPRGNVEDVILVASGEKAGEVAVQVVGQGDIRVTRLDLQMTVKVAEERRVAEELRAQTLQMRADGIPAHRRAMTYYSSDTGDTLYIGDRSTKTRYIRVYDKGGQLGSAFRRVWRFEVEYHRSLAGKILETVMAERSIERSVICMVTNEMVKVGLIIPGSRQAEIVSPERVEWDADKTIEWLGNCVKPALVKLSKAGLLDEGLGALGLRREWVMVLDEIYHGT